MSVSAPINYTIFLSLKINFVMMRPDASLGLREQAWDEFCERMERLDQYILGGS